MSEEGVDNKVKREWRLWGFRVCKAVNIDCS